MKNSLSQFFLSLRNVLIGGKNRKRVWVAHAVELDDDIDDLDDYDDDDIDDGGGGNIFMGVEG